MRLVLRLRTLAFAAFLVWRLRIGACGVGVCVFFGSYDIYPMKIVGKSLFTVKA